MPVKSDDLYYVQTSSVKSQNLGVPIDVTISDAAGTYTMKYSVLSYAYAVNDKSDNNKLIDVVNSLYLYNQAAINYFAQ